MLNGEKERFHVTLSCKAQKFIQVFIKRNVKIIKFLLKETLLHLINIFILKKELFEYANRHIFHIF